MSVSKSTHLEIRPYSAEILRHGYYRRRRHFATKNPSFCYTFILKNSFILLHPCTALALGSPHICSKLRDIKFLQQL